MKETRRMDNLLGFCEKLSQNKRLLNVSLTTLSKDNFSHMAGERSKAGERLFRRQKLTITKLHDSHEQRERQGQGET